MKRIVCLLLSLLLIFPALALAFELPVMADDAIDFSNMTVEDLHILHDLIEDEISNRADISINTKRSASAKSESIYVWISGSGKKYHADDGCSGMNNPKRVTLEDAVDAGRTPCSRCDPPKMK